MNILLLLLVYLMLLFFRLCLNVEQSQRLKSGFVFNYWNVKFSIFIYLFILNKKELSMKNLIWKSKKVQHYEYIFSYLQFLFYLWYWIFFRTGNLNFLRYTRAFQRDFLLNTSENLNIAFLNHYRWYNMYVTYF